MEENGTEQADRRTAPPVPAVRKGFWWREESLSALLLLLVVQLFVLPFVGRAGGGRVALVVFSLLLVSGVATVARRPGMLWVTGALVLLALVLEWSGLADRGGTPRLLHAPALLVSVSLFALLVLARTLGPGPITRRRIEGAVAAYLLIGVACGLGYELVELVTPGALTLTRDLEGGVLRSELEYFSLVTLTTVGYGEVTPVMISSLPSRRD